MPKRKKTMNNISINNICKMLMSNSSFAVFIHENPDADAIGSCFSLVYTLRSIGKKAYAVSTDKIPSSLTFMTQGEKDFSYDMLPKGFTPDMFITVDIATSSLLGVYKNFADRIDLAIDHHSTHDTFAKVQYVDSSASACAEIIYRIVIRLLCGNMPQKTASLLYAAIAADTGGFRYANTTPYTYKVAAKLIEFGADHAEICHNLFDCKSKAAIAAEALAMSTVQYYCDGKIAYVRISLKDKKEHGFEDEDTYDVINTIRKVDGVKIAIFSREREPGQYKITMRSACDIDVSKICSIFGGGGHPGAAGCNVLEKDLDSSVKRIINECGFN